MEKGELEWHKSYYCQNRKGEVTKAICLGDSELHSEELGGTLNIGYWEVLAPVPSYEEWKEKQKSLKVLAEEYCKEKKENQQLNERLLDMIDLLQKCYFYLNAVADGKVKIEHLEQIKTLAVLIDNAIGEKK